MSEPDAIEVTSPQANVLLLESPFFLVILETEKGRLALKMKKQVIERMAADVAMLANKPWGA